MIGYLRNHPLEATSGLVTDCSIYDEKVQEREEKSKREVIEIASSWLQGFRNKRFVSSRKTQRNV